MALILNSQKNWISYSLPQTIPTHENPWSKNTKTKKHLWFPKKGGEHMGVSKNSGIPKSSILIGFSIINHPFSGFPPIFGNIHIGNLILKKYICEFQRYVMIHQGTTWYIKVPLGLLLDRASKHAAHGLAYIGLNGEVQPTGWDGRRQGSSSYRCVIWKKHEKRGWCDGGGSVQFFDSFLFYKFI